MRLGAASKAVSGMPWPYRQKGVLSFAGQACMHSSDAQVPAPRPTAHIWANLPSSRFCPPLAVVSALGAAAVLVVVESAHMCMVARGVEKHASTTLTTAARGAWVEDTTARAAALEALLEQQPHSPRKL